MNRYPRDMQGHGAEAPDPRWPGGARIAVQIVVNYEEGGENCLLHGDPASEAFLSEIVGAAAWPGQRHWNMESIYEYGARAGFWRLHRLLGEFDVPATVFGVATALARSPAQVAAMQEARWEIASHALKWIEHKDMTPEEEAAQIAEAIRLHEEVTGARPEGWYTGRCSMNTVELAATQGMAYVADSYADDLPYWIRAAGRDQLVVPYTLDANDMRFATPQGFNSGEQFFAYLRDSFDALYAEGEAGAPKMMSIGLHCRLAGRPGRVMALRRFLEHARAHDGVWFARRIDIARHWQAHHPPARRERPSEMSRDAFLAAFGGVVEGAPWLAERAFELELGPAHDTATGLANAFGRTLRRASDAERRAALAGARGLGEMLAEGDEADFGPLAETEREALVRLAAAHAERHGIPLVIAPRGQDAAGLRAEIERRIVQDADGEIAETTREIERSLASRLKELLP